MSADQHGGDIYRHQNVMDFSVNVNPLGIRKEVLQAYHACADEIGQYPDVRNEALKGAIADFEQVDKDMILCGNGAAELIYATAEELRPEKALLIDPSFSEYERALESVGAQICRYEKKEETGFLLEEDVLDLITPDLDLMFLTQPDNPTGMVAYKSLLTKIVEKCEDCRVMLLIDECFLEFLDTPASYEMSGLLKEAPHLLILKALTKLFAIPGLRVGYLLSGQESVLARIRLGLQPWNVSVPAGRCAVAALTDCEDYLDRTRALVREGRKYIKDSLSSFGFSVYDSKVNYVFFQGEQGLYEKALGAGFLIRDWGEIAGKWYYRIAVKKKEENERLMTWLKRL